MPDWETEARPVLVAIYEMVEKPPAVDVTSETVADALGRDHRQVARVMSYLSSADYVDTRNAINQRSGEMMVEVEGLRERTLQELAGWPAAGAPPDASLRLIAIIDERMKDASADERTRLARLREGVLAVGTDVLSEVLTKLATGAL